MVRAVIPLCLALAACAGGEAATRTAESPSIISVNPCSDQLLQALGADDQLIAVSQWSHDPESASASPEWAARFPATSGRVEEIALDRPDLVLSGGFLPPQNKAMLARLDIGALDFPVPVTVDDSLAQIEEVGRAIGREDAATETVSNIRASIERSSARDGEGRRAIVLTGSALTGENTLIGDMLVRMGYENAAADYGVANLDNLRLERLIADPPDIVFAAPDVTLFSHPALAALDIERRPFPRRLSWCAGPTMVAMAQALEYRP